MMLGMPGALWWLLLVPLVILLYVLRTERNRVPIPSVRLWRGLSEELEARRKWRPPRWTLLLALQLALVVLGALALSEPALWRRPGHTHLVLVLDASASMGATDEPPTRFAAAQRLALQRLARLGPTDRATVIRAGAEARVLSRAEAPAVARDAVEGATVGEAPGDLRTALLLAGVAADGRLGQAQVVVLSDGAHGPPALPGELPVPVEFERVGRGGSNLAVTALALRRPPNGGATAGFGRVTNFALQRSEVVARLLADGLPLEQRRLDLAPGASEEFQFRLPPGTRAVSLQIEGTDLLAADNRAEARTPGATERTVTLVAAQPELLARALRALPSVRVSVVAPEQYPPPAMGSVVIFDGFLPRSLPAADVIVVNPPAGGWLEVEGEATLPTGLDWDRAHPLLEAIDPAAFQLARLVALRPPGWASPVVWAGDQAVVLEGMVDQRRVLILAFDPRASNLPRLRAFPLLLSNALEQLGWGEREGVVLAGQPIRLPPAGTAEVIDTPGERLVVPSGSVYVATERVGRYAVYAGAAAGLPGVPATAGAPLAEFRVSLLAPAESELAPRSHPPLAGALAGPAPDAPALGFFALLLVAALGVSTAEWWWWGKGHS